MYKTPFGFWILIIMHDYQISNFMKFRTVKAALFCVDVQTDDELIVAFCSFPTRTKNVNAVGNVTFSYTRMKFIDV